MTKKEFWDRVFSTKQKDSHQPNIFHFLSSRNEEFRLSQFGPRSLIKWFLYKKEALKIFHLLQVSPKKGTVVIYQSDMLHAGPDNKSEKPRYFLSLNIARIEMDENRRRFGYSPHSSLLADPKTLGQLIENN